MLQFVRYPLPLAASVVELRDARPAAQKAEEVRRVAHHGGAVALGTDRGTVWVLDATAGSAAAGVQLRVHARAVRDLCWDTSGAFLASCGDDGAVAVQGRRHAGGTATDFDEWEGVETAHFSKAVLCVALDPRYAFKRDRIFVCGGESGDLVRHCRGWFANSKDAVLDDGDGAVHKVAWGGNWIAWANDKGVKLLASETLEPVSFIRRPAGSLDDDAAGCGCCLVWEGDALLLGWGDVVMRVVVTPIEGVFDGARRRQMRRCTCVYSYNSDLGAAPTFRAEIVQSWQTDCIVVGLAPFDYDHLALLGFAPDEVDASGGNARPELQIVRRKDGVVKSADALPMVGYDALGSESYSLDCTYAGTAPADQSAASWRAEDWILIHNAASAADSGDSVAADGADGASAAGGSAAAGHDRLASTEARSASVPSAMRGVPPSLYVVSPRDVVVVRVRDVDDQLDVVLSAVSARRHRDALTIARAQSHKLRRHRMHDLVKGHLDAMLSSLEFDSAAAELGELLGSAETLWEYWIFVFDKHDALSNLAPFIPTQNPKLAASVYDMVLERLLATNPKALRDVLRSWGPPVSSSPGEELYSLRGLRLRLDARLKRRDGDQVDVAAVLEASAEVHVFSGHFEKALTSLLSLDPDLISDSRVVFEVIEKHKLYDAVEPAVAKLAAFSKAHAANLLVRHVDRFPIQRVSDTLAKDPQLQLWYLAAVFAEIPEVYAAPEHRGLHGLQVDLYAAQSSESADSISDDDYDSELLRFLRWSSFAPLPAALAACARQAPPLYDEMVYIHGRIGNTREALDILVDHVGSVRRAIEFVEAHDSSLWAPLIEHALAHPAFLAGLLDYAGSARVELAAKLVAQIPNGVQVSGLRQKLCTIFQDQKFQRAVHGASLQASSSDHMERLGQLYHLQRRGILVQRPTLKDGRIQVRPQSEY